GTEYATWMNKDKKHALAFAVLTEERSQIIVRNYRRGEAGKVGRADKDRTCLSCHAMTFEPAAADRVYLNHEGVGCERCHGPAEKWLSIHYLPGWKEKSDTEKMHFGMTPTKNPVQRAKLCADCHIGAPANNL